MFKVFIIFLFSFMALIQSQEPIRFIKLYPDTLTDSRGKFEFERSVDEHKSRFLNVDVNSRYDYSTENTDSIRTDIQVGVGHINYSFFQSWKSFKKSELGLRASLSHVSSDNYKYSPNLSYSYSVGSEKKVISNMFVGVEASVVSLSAAVMFGEANNSNTTNIAFTVSTLDKFKLYAKVGLN